MLIRILLLMVAATSVVAADEVAKEVHVTPAHRAFGRAMEQTQVRGGTVFRTRENLFVPPEREAQYQANRERIKREWQAGFEKPPPVAKAQAAKKRPGKKAAVKKSSKRKNGAKKGSKKWRKGGR